MGVDVTFKSNLPEVMRKIDKASKDKMQEAVNEVRNTVLEKLSGTRKPDPDRMYYVPGTRRRYQASSPGEPPAQATGELRQSIETSVEVEGKTVIGRVGTDAIQGKMTEFGTRHIAPRPWLRKSFEESEAKVKELFMRLWF